MKRSWSSMLPFQSYSLFLVCTDPPLISDFLCPYSFDTGSSNEAEGGITHSPRSTCRWGSLNSNSMLFLRCQEILYYIFSETHGTSCGYGHNVRSEEVVTRERLVILLLETVNMARLC